MPKPRRRRKVGSKKRKARRDMLAAQFLLSAWLDARRGREVHNDSIE